MHLPILPEDALHFYRYLSTHVLIADEQFLITNCVPIQDCTQQLEIYGVFNLAIPHGNFQACYSINNRHLGIMHDETKAVEISKEQIKTCHKANGQFCSLNTPLLPLTNPPTCISAFYAKDKANIKKRCSLQIRKASSVSIPTSVAPNAWIITSPIAAVQSGITHIFPGETPRSIIPHPSTYLDYNQHTVPHHSISIYHHAMNPMNSLSTYHWTQPTSMLLTYHLQNSEYAALRGSLEWNSTPSLGQNTISTHW